MIQLYVDDQKLLAESLKLDYQFKNPIFRGDQGSLLYNFTVPNDEQGNNAKILRHANRIPHYSVRARDSFNLRALVDGLLWINCTATVKEAGDSFQITAQISEGQLYNKTKDVYLDELDLGTLTFDSIADMVTEAVSNQTLRWPQALFQLITVEAPDFDYSEDIGDIEVREQTGKFWPGDIVTGLTSGASAEIPEYNDSTDWPGKLKNIQGEFELNEIIQVDDDNQAIVDELVTNYRLKKNWINYHDNTGYYVMDWGNRGHLMPQLSFVEVIHRMFEALGYRLDDQALKGDEWFEKMYINHLQDVNISDNDSNPVFPLTLFLPHVKVNDIIKALETYFGVFTFPDKKDTLIRLRRFPQKAKEPRNVLSGKSQGVPRVKYPDFGYTLKISRKGEEMPEDLESFVYGSGAKSHTTIIAPVYNIAGYPTTTQKRGTDIGMQVMFKSSSPAGGSITSGGVSLYWEPQNSDGVIDVYHKEELNFWENTKKVEITKHFTTLELMQMDVSRPQYFDGMVYFIEDMSGELQEGREKHLAKLICYTL
jgi:hypothetical protein